MSTHAIDNSSARDRLLDAASELFYEHGVHTVGIDTIIERAAVAKATLYSAFGSKEELVRAYLEARHASRRAAVLAEMALHDDPRGKLLALFDVLVTTLKQPGFRGCAFANASAESGPDSAAAEVTRKARAWLLGVMAEQATALDVAEGRPGATAHLAVRRSPRPIASRPWPSRRHRGQGSRPGTHRCGLSSRAEAAGATGPRGAQRP